VARVLAASAADERARPPPDRAALESVGRRKVLEQPCGIGLELGDPRDALEPLEPRIG
jgi:hypothetical protein